jgi:ADP-ribosylglycohydrolase
MPDVNDFDLVDRSVGALTGAAVGDALGGATEGYSSQQIFERHQGWVTGIVPPFLPDWATARPMSPYHKGDGHITDDTIMTQALTQVYLDKCDHLDAYDMESRLVPLLTEQSVFIPELERDSIPLLRLFLAEKWLVLRLKVGHVDPREAGVGNVVNCGAAMYMAPVGIVNAADPDGAYLEAIDIAGAHQSSFGREAAGVFAAAVASALTPGAGVKDVVDTALHVAHDGTAAAIRAVVAAAEGHDRWTDALRDLRDAVRPFDQVGENYREPGLGARRPSRLHAIEELPIALGLLVVGRGDYAGSVLGAVNYGRDADSIATMAGALAGALGGRAAVPDEWVRRVSSASRRDFVPDATRLAELARSIFIRDQSRATRRSSAFTVVAPPGSGPASANSD